MASLDDLKRQLIEEDPSLICGFKVAEYEVSNGFYPVFPQRFDGVIELGIYPNNKLKAEHRPMRRTRHYGRKENSDWNDYK